MDTIRNVLVQFGDPLTFVDVGDGLIASTDGKGNLTLGASTNLTQRCAASQVLRGSWMLRVDIVSVASGLYTNFAIGVAPSSQRETMAARRPCNTPRPQDWSPISAGQGMIAMDRSGTIWIDGTPGAALPAPPDVGDSIYVIYDSGARTLTLRHNDPESGPEVVADDVDGPLRFVANAAFTAVSLRIAHDIERLPRIEGIRPAGVFGRLATIGVMDTAADVVWDGRIAEGGDPTFSISAGFAVMGQRGRTRAIGDITAINTAELPGSERRALDDWMLWSVRDQPITILRGDYGKALNTYTAVARGAIDSISEPREGLLAISCRDNSVLLDVPWQAETYPDTTPLVSLRGRSKPTVTGLVCRAAALVQTDTANLLYDVSDDRVGISQVYDQGVQLTLGAGYSLNTDGRGVKRLTNPVGLQCALLEGGWVEASAADVCIGTTVGDFVQWSGSPSTPRGWANPTTGTGASVTSTVDGARFVRALAGQADLLAANVLGTTAGTVRIDIDISAHVSGSLLIRAETSGGTASTLATINTTGVTGPRTIMASLPASRPYLRLRVAAAGDITVRSLRIVRPTTVSTAAHFVRYAACFRGQLGLGDLDSSVAAFPVTSPLCLVTGVGDNRTVLSVLDDVMASVGGAWWFGRDGKLACGALAEPGKTPVVELDDLNIEGDITSTLDSASGLSTRVAGDPTWAVHSDTDIAGSLNTSDAGRQFAEALKAEHATVKTGSYPVAPEYQFAISAPPIKTLLSTAIGAALLADTYTEIYGVQRRIWRCTANLEDALALLPLDNVALNTPSGVRRTRVLALEGRYASDTVNLSLWG